ncbi:hypothetical protein [Caulobacter radicis]|uniref:hypothetical protein n=1 Tax=Caulobacter radicis TaxID=2172650 RepID=UPI0010579ECA|nr:hypothetical protein [Caulobacter radicis]
MGNLQERRGTYAAVFGGEAPRLRFLATRHSGDLDSQTFRGVREILATSGLRSVVVEGIDTSLGINPNLSRYRSMSATNFRGGEATYATMLAAQSGVDYIGGEIGIVEINRKLAKSFSVEEIRRAYLVREVSSRANVRGFQDEADFRKFVIAMIEHFGSLDESLVWSSETASDWYISTYGLPLSREVSVLQRGSPCGQDKYAPVILEMTNVRNRHLLALIERTASRAPSLAVVYGSGHLRALLAPLEKTFGAARFQFFA